MNDEPGHDIDPHGWVIFIFWPFVLVLTMACIIAYGWYVDSKKSKGYGGSPGHMSPMEVEALYEKNKNARP